MVSKEWDVQMRVGKLADQLPKRLVLFCTPLDSCGLSSVPYGGGPFSILVLSIRDLWHWSRYSSE